MLLKISDIALYPVSGFQKLCNIGVDPLHPEAKYLRIINGILIFDIFACFFYMLYYNLNPGLNAWGFQSCFIFLILFSFLYFLNLKKYHDTARMGLIFVANLGVTIQAYLLGSKMGLQDILYILYIVPFLLFPPQKWEKMWFGILITTACFFIYHYFLKSEVGFIEISNIDALSKIFLIANASIALLIALLITQNLYFKEQELTQKNEDLQKEYEKAKLMSLVAEKTTNGVLICNEKEEILWANNAFLSQSDFESKESLLGKKASIVQGSQMTAEQTQNIKNALFDTKNFNSDMQVAKKNGDLYWVNLDISRVYDEKNNFTHLVSVQRDITRRKEYENEIMYNKLLFQTIFDISSDCLMLVDFYTFEILLINNRGLQLFEANNLEELKTKKTAINLRKANLSKTEIDMIENKIRTEGFWTGEVEYKTLKNNIFLGEAALKIFELNNKKFRLAKITDITHRKNSELQLLNYNKQLEQLTNDLRQFAHIAAHDLKSPLRSIINYLQILQYRYVTQLDEKALEYIDFAVKGGTDLSNLIDEILRYSELNNETNANLEPLNLNTIVHDCSLFLEKNFLNKKILIKYPTLPTILADRVQMLQLFQNLIGNGLKYNQSTIATVNISCSFIENTNMYHFCITDNGIGIDPAYHKQIFDMFKRLNNKTEYEGTGIGLAICKKIVELNGGNIWVESELGKGATFCFTIKNHHHHTASTNNLNNDNIYA